MWSDWLVYHDCGCQSVCPLIGRDWLKGKLGLVLMGGAMLSKSLIQFSVDRLGCVPSLLFDLSNEDNGNLLQKVPCMHCLHSVPPTLLEAIANPCLCQRLLDTHRQVWASLLWGHCSFLLCPGEYKVLFVKHPKKNASAYNNCFRKLDSVNGRGENTSTTTLVQRLFSLLNWFFNFLCHLRFPPPIFNHQWSEQVLLNMELADDQSVFR